MTIGKAILVKEVYGPVKGYLDDVVAERTAEGVTIRTFNGNSLFLSFDDIVALLALAYDLDVEDMTSRVHIALTNYESSGSNVKGGEE